MISPQINLCFRRYFHTFPCVISVPVTSYDFAANKLLFSQLFPYSLLFNLSTGYILTTCCFGRYFGPYHRNLNEIAVFFNEIAAVLAVNFYVFNNNSFSRLAYWCWTHCRDWSRDLGFLCIRPHAPVRPYPHLHLSPRGLSPIRTSGRYTRVPGGWLFLLFTFISKFDTAIAVGTRSSPRGILF